MTAYIAVSGPAEASEEEIARAEEVGRRLADRGAIVLCGGLGGVMDGAARGASRAGGTVIGLLPGETRAGASLHLSASIPTGIGEARNALLVRAADGVIAIGGAWGTLSEIALALKMGRPVVGLATWEPVRGGRLEPGIIAADSAEDAVRRILGAVR